MDFSAIDVKWLAFVFTVVVAVTYGFLRVLDFKTKSQKLSYIRQSFAETVEKLSSEKEAERLSAAILLRRFLDKGTEVGSGKTPYRFETINVIAALLRTTSSGIFQKTLADALAFAGDIDKADLQKTNLQNAYLGSKHEIKVVMRNADFFQANLSNASLKNSDFTNAIFYQATLHNTVFNGTHLHGASFDESDLLGASFNGAKLDGASFRAAINVPVGIKDKLDAHGVYPANTPVSTAGTPNKRKTIFISSPGILSPEQSTIVEYFLDLLKSGGHDIVQLRRSDYPKFEQISALRRLIKQSSGVVCFGFPFIDIHNGIVRPATTDHSDIKEQQYVSTPWVHLEVGMAAMSGAPILIVKDDKVTDGIFEPCINDSLLYFANIASGVHSQDVITSYRRWTERL